jgi:hypothetical protein
MIKYKILMMINSLFVGSVLGQSFVHWSSNPVISRICLILFILGISGYIYLSHKLGIIDYVVERVKISRSRKR